MSEPGMKTSRPDSGTAVKYDDEVEVQLTSVPLGPAAGSAELTASGILLYGTIVVGPNPTNADRSVLALMSSKLKVDVPRVVILQPRQGDNQNFGWTDQFAVQVITTERRPGADAVGIRVRRIDGGSGTPIGWGQNLRVDILIIDDGTETE